MRSIEVLIFLSSRNARSRLIAGNTEYVLFEAMLNCLKQRGLIKAGGRQRTDATPVLASVRAINRVICVGETMRATLNTLAQVAPEWLQSFAPDEWYERVSRIALRNIGCPKSKPSVRPLLKQ